jgi:hypothetical protein
MDWERLLRLAPGETIGADPAEVFGDGQPIIELSETVLPREIVVARHDDGSDILASILHDRQHDAYTVRVRYRVPDGRKRVPPQPGWLPAEEGRMPASLLAAFDDLERHVRQAGGKAARLSIPATADAGEVMRRIVESGEFDVFQADEKEGTVRRLA